MTFAQSTAIERNKTRLTAEKQSWKGDNAMQTSSQIHIRKVLVPIDFSPESVKPLSYAGALAKTHGARVILLHVTTPRCLSLDYGYGPVARYGRMSWHSSAAAPVSGVLPEST